MEQRLFEEDAVAVEGEARRDRLILGVARLP